MTDRTPSQATRHSVTIRLLAPLVSHIATLEDQVQRLTEASPMWQIRARQAEEQLNALTAGETRPEAPQEAVESPQTNETGPRGEWDSGSRMDGNSATTVDGRGAVQIPLA